MKKYLLQILLMFFVVGNLSAQSYYKMWAKQERKDATFTKREIKKAAKEYAKLIYEDAKKQKEIREDWVRMSEKKQIKKKKDLFALRIQSFRNARFKVKEGSKHSLEEQTMTEIDLAWNFDSKTFFPEKIEGQAKVISKTYEAAIEKAMVMARSNLASEIVHEVMMQFAYKDFVKEFGLDKSQEITQAILDVREPLTEEIGEVIVAQEIFNSKNYASTEVMLRIFYDGSAAIYDFKKTLDKVITDDPDLVRAIKSFLDEPINN